MAFGGFRLPTLNFSAFGRGLSLRRRNCGGVMTSTCISPPWVVTCIEASLEHAEDLTVARISPPSGGDFH